MGDRITVDRQRLGRSGLEVSPIGFGGFKIGRNQGIKYPDPYTLPSDEQVDRLLGAMLDIGINYFDTAPAYGLSEQRIGQVISHRRNDLVISTKVGERFEAGQSTYDYSTDAVRQSIERSLHRLRTDVLDLVFVHCDGNDLAILTDTDIVADLQHLRERGLIRAIGMSGKTPEGAKAALAWADVIMVEYHTENRAHEAVMAQAASAGVGVVVKKGLGSGRLVPAEAVRFVLDNPAVGSLLIGSLDLEHMRHNMAVAQQVRSKSGAGCVNRAKR